MSADWAARYDTTIRLLPAVAARARLTFCGNGACIDARVQLHDIGPMLEADDAAAASFARQLQARAARGQGGEIACDWAGGPDWITSHLPVAFAMGGTGPHAAAAISAVGAPALVALGGRSAQMLGLMPPGVLLAEDGGLVRAGEARRRGGARLPVFIFEYTAGQRVGDVVPQRSSRIIVRFGNFSLEDDPDFARVTAARAVSAGAGLMSGFSSVAAADMPAETGRVVAQVRTWRAGGLQTVHLELAGFETLDLMHATLRAARGAATSVGMSLSELQAIEGDGQEVADAMCALGDRLGLDRVCIHADHWAASVTRRDPAQEMHALITGCLLAGARAATGRPARPERLDEAVTFEPLPFPPLREAGAWNFVACASPYLRAPATTLGLGDTFTGGCLLALGAGR